MLQLTTAFKEGGLRNRKGTFFYKDHLPNINVPVFAVAGDRDLICPPEAVYGLFLFLSNIVFWPISFLNLFSFFSRGPNIYTLYCKYHAETVKAIPKDLVTYKVFGEPNGPHYAHYDLVGGRMVCILITPFDLMVKCLSHKFMTRS